MKLPVMTVAADIVVLTIADIRLQMALVEWDIPSYKGKQALPGGFVLPGESVMDAARRGLVEEIGLGLDATHLEQLATFDEPGRDLRGRVVSVAHLALATSLGSLTLGSDASGARWCPADDLPPLTFDYDEILRTGIERARAELKYTTVAARFCGPRFTMTELRQVCGAAWGVEVDPQNFSCKMLDSRGSVVEYGTRSGDRRRPAALYRVGAANSLHPPIMREG